MVETCVVADQFCTAPANLHPPIKPRGICFSCEGFVCSKCSSKRKYYNYGRVRLCNDCQVDYDGNEKIVMRRLYKLAGY